MTHCYIFWESFGCATADPMLNSHALACGAKPLLNQG